MLLFSISVFIVLLTVSEAASNEYRLRVEDSHHQPDGDKRRLNRQRYPLYDEVIDTPCDRRAQSDPLVYQDSPNRISPGIGNQRVPATPVPARRNQVDILPYLPTESSAPGTGYQQASVMPVSSRRSQEEILPYLSTESLAPKKQSKPIHKIPDETQIDSVGRSAEPNPKSNFKVPLKQNTQQVDRQGIESQPGFLTQIKAQHPQVYDTENRESPQLNSEEVKELIQRHNNDIPSHQDAIHYVPVQNRTIEPQKSHNYHDFTSTNLNREAEPSEDNHIHIINTLKPKPIHDRTTSSESCNIERKDSYEDLLPEGRRAMSKGSNNDTDRSSGWQSPSTETLRSGQAGAKAILQQPNVLTKPTYQLSDPTRGAGIAPLSEVRGLLMESSRVCFACSTLNDASCTIPDRTTTIKYCRQGQEVCVTKSYRKNAGARLVVIRDCGTSCDADTSGLNTRYESCAVCKEDLCNSLNIENSAFSISAINSIFVLLCTALVKHIF